MNLLDVKIDKNTTRGLCFRVKVGKGILTFNPAKETVAKFQDRVTNACYGFLMPAIISCNNQDEKVIDLKPTYSLAYWIAARENMELRIRKYIAEHVQKHLEGSDTCETP